MSSDIRKILDKFYRRLWNEIFLYQVNYNYYRERFWKTFDISLFNSFDIRPFIRACVIFMDRVVIPREPVIREELVQIFLPNLNIKTLEQFDDFIDDLIKERPEIEDRLPVYYIYRSLAEITRLHKRFGEITEKNYEAFIICASLIGIYFHQNDVYDLDYLYPTSHELYEKYHIKDPLYNNFPRKFSRSDVRYIHETYLEEFESLTRPVFDIPRKITRDVKKLQNDYAYDLEDIVEDIPSLFEVNDSSFESQEKWRSLLTEICKLDSKNFEGEYSRFAKLFSGKILSMGTSQGITYEYKMKMGELEKLVVGKVSLPFAVTPSNIQNIFEYQVGSRLNKVYDKIPIFMYTYAMGQYTPGPLMPGITLPSHSNQTFNFMTRVNREMGVDPEDDIDIVTTFYQHAGKGSRSLNEYLYYPVGKPHKDIKDHNENVAERFYFIFFTILESLRFIHQETGFVHNDLHFQNILMKKFDKAEEHVFFWNGNFYKTRNETFPFIIDYGFAVIRKDMDKEYSVRNVLFPPYGLEGYKRPYIGYLDDWSQDAISFVSSFKSAVNLILTEMKRDKNSDSTFKKQLEELNVFVNNLMLLYFFNITLDDLPESYQERMCGESEEYISLVSFKNSFPVQRNYYPDSLRRYYLDSNNWPPDMKKFFERRFVKVDKNSISKFSNIKGGLQNDRGMRRSVRYDILKNIGNDREFSFRDSYDISDVREEYVLFEDLLPEFSDIEKFFKKTFPNFDTRLLYVPSLTEIRLDREESQKYREVRDKNKIRLYKLFYNWSLFSKMQFAINNSSIVSETVVEELFDKDFIHESLKLYSSIVNDIQDVIDEYHREDDSISNDVINLTLMIYNNYAERPDEEDIEDVYF